MPLTRRDFTKLGLGACLLSASFSAGTNRALGVRPQGLVSERIYVFGTLVEVHVHSADQEAAREAIAAVSRDFIEP